MQDFIREAKCSFAFNQGAKEISRICKPFLNKWNFENFYYVRISRQGKLVYLTNHIDFAMDYWEAGLPLRTGFAESPQEVQSFSVLWENCLEKEILNFAATQNCYSGFSMIDRYYDTIQFVSFLHSTPVDNLSQYYVKHEPILRCWLREFEWKNRHLIKHAEENPMLLPREYVTPQKEVFYPERTVKLRHGNIQSKISFRQMDCLYLHSRGFTCPHIAKVLELSERTVETHLEAVKDRFGLSSRDELAQLAYANPLIQSYAPRLGRV